MSLAVIDAGLSYQRRTFADFSATSIFEAHIHIQQLGDVDLSISPSLMIPCRTAGHRLAKHKQKLERYVREGGILFVMGETQPDLFLDDLDFTPEPTNFWWWKKPSARLGVTITSPFHPLMLGLTDADCTWHVHGTIRAPEGGRPLIAWNPPSSVAPASKAGPLMVEYELGKGRVVVTTLDPIYHHGSGFMPATTRFLNRFLPNAKTYVLAHKKMVELSDG